MLLGFDGVCDGCGYDNMDATEKRNKRNKRNNLVAVVGGLGVLFLFFLIPPGIRFCERYQSFNQASESDNVDESEGATSEQPATLEPQTEKKVHHNNVPGFLRTLRLIADRVYQLQTKTVSKVNGVKLKLGDANVSNGLDKRIIHKVISQHRSDIEGCIKVEGSQGEIIVKWTIDATGNVPNAFVTESTMGNPSVEACLVKSIQHWRFPAPKNGGVVIVSYPFVFETEGNIVGVTKPPAPRGGSSKHCVKGKPCGNSCIAVNKTCHK